VELTQIIDDARKFLLKGQTNDAITHLEKYLVDHTESPQIYNVLGNLYIQLDSREKLEELASLAFKSKVFIPELLVVTGEAFWQKNDLENAIHTWHQCISLNPENYKANYYLGIAFKTLENYPEAEIFLQKANKLSPKETILQLELAEVFLKRHRYQMVLQLLRQIPSKNGNKELYHLLYAKSSMAMFDYETAIKHINRLIKMDAENIEYILLKIDIYIEKGNLSYSRKLIQQNRKKFQKEPAFILREIKYLFTVGKLKKAMKETDALLNDSPNDPMGLLWKGKLLIAQDNPEAALITLSKATENQKNDPEILMQIAEAWDMYGNLDQAIGIINEALKSDPENITLMDRMGEYLLRRQNDGDMEQSRLIFESVLNANYLHPGANYHLAWYYGKSQKYKKALNHIQIARQQNPKSFDSFILHSIILDHMKEGDKLEKLLQDGLDLFPDKKGKISSWLLTQYLNSKNLPDAISLYKQKKSTHDGQKRVPEILVYKRRSPQKSVVQLEELLNEKNVKVQVYLELGYLYVLEKDYRNAFRIWRLIQNIFDYNAESAFNMASTQFNNGRQLKAQQLLTELLEKGYHRHIIYYLFGKVMHSKGDLEKALVYFNKAKEIKIYRCLCAAEIGAVYYEQQKLKESIEYFEQGLRGLKKKFPYLNQLANAYYRTQKLTKAVRIYEKAIKNDPANLENYTQLMELYQNRGQYRHSEIVEQLYHRAQDDAQISRLIDEGQVGEVATLVVLIFNDGRKTGGVGKIEASLIPGRGGLILTGNMTTYFKEASKVAHNYLRAKSEVLGIEQVFKKNAVHLHIPHTGGIPTDGPSAGLALASAIYSAILKRKISPQVAMTGEISLHGDTLSIGGLEHKAAAAAEDGINKLYIPKDNYQDYEQLPENLKQELEIILVEHIEEVFTDLFGPLPRKPR